MGIREKLKEREEARDKAAQGAGGGINAGLPEGVTRYVKLRQELAGGKTFVLLAPYTEWYFYYTHEDGEKYPSRETYYRKHTCSHSPKKAPANEDEGATLFDQYAKPNGNNCLSCKAKAKRKLYFMMPVYDPEYKTWRVLDLKEFHATNLMDDFDKLEKAAKKFKPDYTLTGDAVTIGKADKSYSLESADLDEGVLEAARAFIGSTEIKYEELANFRTEDDIREILKNATKNVDQSVLEDGPITVSDEDLPF
ncbi:single-stranded DNA-binding protein [Brevibacillus laterosporus]|uniref:single-stranded DNA-binding protein n=1 Tax=Brevibacillus laterosporus TaxID=1465 RepID=UPI002656AB61|nr:single-stranded DNA-binding protein [Brevibacillus laterosporus]MDN9010031.1 single-stranded DNA-binding protein [Brevibacillus laterosporus]MDO0940587.1 single-stranded DNA-binding protein [Brevibacillus laterosporus]